MKRPGLYLTILFISIICSTAIVSAVISGIAKSFQNEEVENTHVKSAPAESSSENVLTQASIKL